MNPTEKTPSITYNFIMNAILGASNFLFPLIVTPYVSRVLLPEGTGKVAFAASLIAYFNLFAQLGVPVYGIRACARVRDDRDALTRTVYELLAVSLSMSLLAYMALFAALFFIPRLREDRTLYLVMSLSILLGALGIEWMYKGLEQYAYITVRSVIFKGIAVAALFLLVRSPEDTVLYGAVTVFASSGSYLCNLFHARKYIDLRPGLTRLRSYRPFRHLREVLVFFAMSCSTTIYTQLDAAMLGFLAADKDVGYYNAAVQVKTALVYLVALGSVLLPRVSYYVARGDMERFHETGRKALHFVFLVAVPLAAYFTVFAGPCIFLLSGPAYAGSVGAMRIIMPALPLIGVTNILGNQILVPLGREKRVLCSEVAGAGTDMVLNLLLIPKMGAAGAALGTLAAEAVVLGVQVCGLGDLRRKLFRGIPYGRILIAAAGALASCLTVTVLCRPFLRDAVGRNFTLGNFLCLAVSVAVFFVTYGMILLLTKEELTVETVRRITRRRF